MLTYPEPRTRRRPVVLPQDWPALAPAATAALHAWEARVEQQDRPALERRYRAALDQGDGKGGDQLLASFTRRLAGEAGELLDALTAQAAQALGLPGVPSDDRLLQLLEEAAEAYAFEPTSDAAPAPWRTHHSAVIKGSAGAALFAPRQAVVA